MEDEKYLIEQLTEELHRKDEDLQKAARFGKELLATNSDLSQKLEEAASISAAKIEALQQECYALKQKSEQCRYLQEDYTQEIEAVEKQLSRAQQQHKTEVSSLQQQLVDKQRQVDMITAECDRGQQVQKNLETRIDDLLKEADTREDQHREEIQALKKMDTTLAENISDETQAKMLTMEQNLQELQSSNKHLQAAVEKLEASVQTKQWEAQNAESEAASNYNALQKAREEIQELKVEIDVILMDSQDTKKKGNSLFSEVEDRRVAAEKALLSLKSKHEALQHTHKVTSEQFCRVKLQMANMLQLCSHWADQAHVERLQRQLSLARNQIHELINSRSVKQTDDEEHNITQACTESDSKELSFFKALLSHKEKRISDLEEDMKMKDLALYSESQKIIDRERELYKLEQNRDHIKAKALQLEVQVNELLLKYDPESLKSEVKSRKIITDKIPKEAEESKENLKTDEILNPQLPKNLQKQQDPMVRRCLEKIARKRHMVDPFSAPQSSVSEPVFRSETKKSVSISTNDEQIVVDECDVTKEVTDNVLEESTADNSSSVIKTDYDRKKSKQTVAAKAEVIPECKQQ